MSKITRRQFICSTAVAGAAMAAFGNRAMAQSKETWIAELGKVKDLNEKAPVLVKALFKNEDGVVMEEEKIYVRWVRINENAGRWVVLSSICQHLKCKVDFNSHLNKFTCPCHGSQYDIEGRVVKKPSRKDLPDYSDLAYEDDGRLMLERTPD